MLTWFNVLKIDKIFITQVSAHQIQAGIVL